MISLSDIFNTKKGKSLFIAFILIQCLGWACFFILGKKDSFLFFHHLLAPNADHVMPYITLLGDGYWACMVCLMIWILKGWKYGLPAGLSFLLSGLLVQGAKHSLQFLRPAAVIKPEQMHPIPGHTFLQQLSFPSGHSTTAWAVFVFLGLMIHSSRFQSVWVVLACLVSWSRMYLGQHFLDDVLAGGAIGFAFSWVAFRFSEKINN